MPSTAWLPATPGHTSQPASLSRCYGIFAARSRTHTLPFATRNEVNVLRVASPGRQRTPMLGLRCYGGLGMWNRKLRTERLKWWSLRPGRSELDRILTYQFTVKTFLKRGRKTRPRTISESAPERSFPGRNDLIAHSRRRMAVFSPGVSRRCALGGKPLQDRSRHWLKETGGLSAMLELSLCCQQANALIED